MQSQVSNEQTGWNTLGGQSHPPQFLYAKSSKLLFERRRLCGLHLRLSASAKNFSCYTVSVNRHLEFQNSSPKGLKAIYDKLTSLGIFKSPLFQKKETGRGLFYKHDVLQRVLVNDQNMASVCFRAIKICIIIYTPQIMRTSFNMIR